MSSGTEPRMLEWLTIPYRYRGPKTSGNGGYTAGLLAGYLREGSSGQGLPGPVEVTLRRPPPIDAPLRVMETDRHVQLRTSDDAVVAEAVTVASPDPVDAVESVSYEAASAAEAAFGGRDRHPFPACFVCGTGRSPDDALCLRPGRLGDGRTACTWVPSASIGADFATMWAVLDCPSGWSADIVGRPVVLGRILAVIHALPAVGARCVVMGEFRGEEGRKVFTASTLYDEDDRVLASARQVWIAVDPVAFGED